MATNRLDQFEAIESLNVTFKELLKMDIKTLNRVIDEREVSASKAQEIKEIRSVYRKRADSRNRHSQKSVHLKALEQQKERLSQELEILRDEVNFLSKQKRILGNIL